MNHAHIPGFPNQIPNIYWEACLPIFKYQKGDDVALHLFRFHKHIHKLGVELHEDSLIKMFMVSLEGNARSWYDGLPAASLYSLKYFHSVFHEHFKDQYPYLLLVPYCCMHYKGFLESLKDIYGGEELLDEEILEILQENSFPK